MKIDNYFIKWSYYENNATTCMIIEGDTVLSEQTALCGKKDTFSKNIGRKESLTKALRNTSFSKELRIKIWNAYRNMTDIPRW